jgi:uncharacterized phiE125 gp8 family phage protein
MASYRLVTAPSTEPLTYSEVKAYLRLNGDSEEAFVTSLIVVARQYVESQIWRPLISQVQSMNFDKSELTTQVYNINKAPVISINSVTYYDLNNALQTLNASDWESDIYSNPARFRIKTLPQIYDRMNALQVNFTCGYSNAASVPLPIKQAMLMLIGHYYENRQIVMTGTQVNEVPFAAETLLNPFRNNYIFAPLN